MSLIADLLTFREEAARREGVESFRVFPKATLDAIAQARPRDKAELTSVKGIKEAKYRKYGQAILAIVAAHSVSGGAEEMVFTEPDIPPEPAVLSVDEFLENINTELSGLAARVRGEVNEVNIWQNRLVFFSIKDGARDSVLKCSMSYQAYQVSGIFFSVGDEVIVEGYARMYKPRGELSFQAVTAEFFGEGALKKAYDELYKKLEAEGAFDLNQKRELPLYPERIALITSADGAAIGDFQMNIGRFGLSVHLYPSGVEGKRAVLDLLQALMYFKKKSAQYDVLVVVRGGGSLESLQAFNNETLVREIQSFPIPVLCGIGHEKDITLAALVGDRMESTPTACALALTQHWESARHRLSVSEEKLPALFERVLTEERKFLTRGATFLFERLRDLRSRAQQLEAQFMGAVLRLGTNMNAVHEELLRAQKFLLISLQKNLENVRLQMGILEKRLAAVDPNRVLRLGYSLVRAEGQLVRSSETLVIGDILEIELSQGSVITEVKQKKD